MKKNVRFIGIDDAPFKFRKRSTIVIGAIMRSAYLEAILKTRIKIDGMDANEKIAKMLKNSRYKEQIRAVFIDGVTLGGFNVIDIHKLYEEIKIPVITVTRDKPNFNSIKSALKLHFDDWKLRWNIIKRGKIKKIETEHNPIYVMSEGIEEEELKKIIKLSIVRGAIPECIRVAHIIATGIKIGESYGRA